VKGFPKYEDEAEAQVGQSTYLLLLIIFLEESPFIQ